MLISEVPNTYFPGWCNFWKTEHLYDSTSRLEKMIEFDGDCSSIWKLERQNLFTYDGRGNKIDDIRQLWIDSIWINDSQYKYEYDSSNVLIRTVFLDWQPDSLKWENVWRESYTQNISSNLVRTLTEIWYNQTEWQNSKNRIIGYDDNENWIQDATQNWDSIQWVNQFRYLATWYEPVSVDDNINSVNNFSLSQNYPNPFNPTTIINYQLSEHSFVTIKVYDVLGKEIVALVNEQKPAGNYEIQLDGNGLTSGIYFYQLKAGSFVETKKMVLIK
ncbi:MAG: T9SS type A sorting domain-containing protein [Ignavibacteria bacterium]|nr:T9SS type A sorting domain-containing protein [Ignavibacteria bacterium]MBT8381904.1 T9SS type A sorting domain-containing protein [Ignavibacteria bacterium]MBT8390587.1 T9SS type A sorting domain-containing protein [Ignavibacteria bacterium]NNL22374.1 T9SS type A sorting domain-containing protein [Ignavibacteriaceae bacterium]